MVFCNIRRNGFRNKNPRHNPYFNRWFSAISVELLINLHKYCHNPYFNRWFSAIVVFEENKTKRVCHNPYFNRWFSAMKKGSQ